MNSQSHSKAEQLNISNKKPLNLGAAISAPVILVTVALLSLAYITDALFAGTAELGIGETSVLSRLLYDSGNLISKFIYPLISAGIAVASGGLGAVPAGLLGGMLAGTGATYANANTNATSISGIFGCIFAGFIGAYSAKIITRFFSKYSQKDDFVPFLVIPGATLIITLFAVLALNTAAQYINHLAASLAGIASKTNGLLLSAILGIFMTADSGGPLYLAGYMFGVASITTGEPVYMAAVIATGAIPSLTMGLYTIIYKERIQGVERILGPVGIAGGLLGLPHPALAFYTKKTYKFQFACVPGGIVASTLSFTFNCSSAVPVGGILGFNSFGRPLFFILALCCGALLSAFLLGIIESDEYSHAPQNEDTSFEETKGLNPQI